MPPPRQRTPVLPFDLEGELNAKRGHVCLFLVCAPLRRGYFADFLTTHVVGECDRISLTSFENIIAFRREND